MESHGIQKPLVALAATSAALVAAAPRIAWADSIFAPVGPIGAGNKIILLDALVIMLAIVIPTMIVTLVFAWWYRESNSRAVYRPEFTYSGKLELLVWSIPALVIFFLGGVIWIGSHKLDPSQPLPSKARPLEIQAVSFDWKWLFIYPEQQIASVNRLVIPVGRPLHFSITSASVFNTFFVPRLGSMIYAMNGMVSQLNLRADKPGTYLGISAMFSGDGFSDMKFDSVAVPANQFASWAAGVKGAPLDRAAVGQLLKQSRAVVPYTYRGVDTSLFNAIALQKLPPGDGPTTGRGGQGGQHVMPHGGQ